MNDAMTDEQFAKWLQDEEFRQQREGNTGSTSNEERLAAERADEEFARRLAAEQQQQQQQQPPPQPPAANNAIALQHGQTIAVRLQHPSSKNQIEEALYAHHVDRNLMMFEMVRKRGSYLRVKDTSESEFSKVVDEASQFSVENCAGGLIYLGPRKHNQKVNLSGSVGWFLALSHNGSLIGNAARGVISQWRLLAAPDAPMYTPLSATTTSNNAGSSGTTSVSNSASQSSHVVESEVANPLFAMSSPPTESSATNNTVRQNSKVQNQLSWLDSSVGQTWLSQDREGRSQLKQLHQEGKLRNLLYRPDWPQAALLWKDYSVLHNQYLSHELNFSVPVNYEEFLDKGYTVCQGALGDTAITNGALKMINYWLGQYPNHPGISPQGNIELSGEILGDQALVALLYETSLIRSIKDFFKDSTEVRPCLKCQISLKFPDYNGNAEDSLSFNFNGKKWHVDKQCDPTASDSYSLLVGIPLSSTTDMSEKEGNLCVYPGKQTDVFEAWCGASRPGGGGAAALTSMCDPMDTSKPDFGQSHELHLKVGDVVFLSPFLPRRQSSNYSPRTNYMVYFRIEVSTAANGLPLDNQQIWREVPSSDAVHFR